MPFVNSLSRDSSHHVYKLIFQICHSYGFCEWDWSPSFTWLQEMDNSRPTSNHELMEWLHKFLQLIRCYMQPLQWKMTVLDLNSNRLSGSIPHSVGNLTCFTGINLWNNSFYGEIPQEVGHLQLLQHLNLTWNSFSGKVPTNLSCCTQLTVVDVAYNDLIGEISDHLRSLSKLVNLQLGAQPYRNYPTLDRKLFFFVSS